MEVSQGTQGLIFEEPVLFEKSVKGRVGYSSFPQEIEEASPEQFIEPSLLRSVEPLLPELSEMDVVRHFTRLSQWNFGIDLGFYPLGSCTMKYNPKINEETASMKGFLKLHPYEPSEAMQGALRLMYELERYLAEIGGMDVVTLQPAAGAQGEFTGLQMIRAFHASKGNARSKVIIPDSAHGTNPASSALCGYQVIEIKSNSEGILSPQSVAALMDEEVAAIMLTNPNTLGLFEKHIETISEIVHSKGGLVYCDGANQNALVGSARVGEMGVDVLHFNLHKTFSTPHGGGGPGAGPVAVKHFLEPFLPVPVILKEGKQYRLDENRNQSIGKVKTFFGNFGMFVRAYTYIRELGSEGLKKVSQMAVLNANYIRKKLEGVYFLPFEGICMHECVFSDKRQIEYGVKTMDIAKRLIDYGFHAPTVYFPLIVPGALMVEPTETESKQTLDAFVEAMKAIADEAKNTPELLTSAPHVSKLKRLDEVKAAKDLKLTWQAS